MSQLDVCLAGKEHCEATARWWFVVMDGVMLGGKEGKKSDVGRDDDEGDGSWEMQSR